METAAHSGYQTTFQMAILVRNQRGTLARKARTVAVPRSTLGMRTAAHEPRKFISFDSIASIGYVHRVGQRIPETVPGQSKQRHSTRGVHTIRVHEEACRTIGIVL